MPDPLHGEAGEPSQNGPRGSYSFTALPELFEPRPRVLREPRELRELAPREPRPPPCFRPPPPPDEPDGTLEPERRASESPIAIACFGSCTFLPERPDVSSPRFISCIARSTFCEAPGP